MKTIKNLFHVTVLAAAVSCSQNEVPPGVTGQDYVPLSVSVSSPTCITRSLVTEDFLTDGSEIGIALYSEQNTDYDGIPLRNVRYTASGTAGAQSWNSEKSIMLSSSIGTLYAYYPYSEHITDITQIPVESSSDIQTDYLYADPVSGLNNHNPEAGITLNHALAAVRLSLSRGNYTGNGNIESISISGDNMATKGILNATNGKISSLEGKGSRISPETGPITLTQDTRDIDILAIPTERSTGISIEISIDGENFSVTTEPVSLQHGVINVFDIQLNNAAIVVYPVKVRSWNKGAASDFSMNKNWNINLNGDTSGISLSHSIDENGAITITAVPGSEDAEVNPVQIEGNAAYLQNIDENTGARTITLSDIKSDINISFDSYTLWTTAIYYITDITTETELLSSSNNKLKCRRLKIDGAEVPAANKYQFSTTGTHTVKFAFTDKTRIPAATFNKCNGLVSLKIPEGVKTIESNCINYCSDLVSISLPETLEYSDYDSMSYNTALKSISLPDNLVMGYQMLQECTSLEEVILPQNLKTIPSNVFTGCTNLKQIDIPESVNRIDPYAFSKCGLTSLTIPKNVTSLPQRMCNSCDDLEYVTLHTGITEIGEDAFIFCSSLAAIVYDGIETEKFALKLHEGLKTLRDNAFERCDMFTSVYIPSTLTDIGKGCFAMAGLESITVSPDNTVYETRDGFNGIIEKATDILIAGCSNATVVPKSVTQIGPYAYYKIPISSIDLHEGITKIGDYAFYACDALHTIISRSLTPPVLDGKTIFWRPLTWGILYVSSEAESAYNESWLSNKTSIHSLGYYYWYTKPIENL